MTKTKPKALGTAWETAVVRYTKEQLGDEALAGELPQAVAGLLGGEVG